MCECWKVESLMFFPIHPARLPDLAAALNTLVIRLHEARNFITQCRHCGPR